MDAQPPTARPAPDARFRANDLAGLRYFRPLRRFLERLHAARPHPNRKLHFDEYVCLLLLYFFNPTLKTLRGLQAASHTEGLARRLGVRPTALGSLSEASQAFEAQGLRAVLLELAAQAHARDAPPRPTGVPDDLALLACDGTLLRALPKMLWAVWLRSYERGVKLHLQFDLLRGVPVGADLTPGTGDEREVLRARLKRRCLYLLDRGFRYYDLYAEILAAKSSFVARVAANTVGELVASRPASAEATAAGVLSDQTVWLGWKLSANKLQQPLRLIHVHVQNPPGHSLRPRLPRVSRKAKSIRLAADEYDLWLVTDLLDPPAESIALLYRYRWQVEIFFRWFKCVLGCKHLLAHSRNGVCLQVYAALIASVLLVLWTGRKPNTLTFTMLTLYFQGWATEKDLLEFLARQKARA
jgi:hypothetical protein